MKTLKTFLEKAHTDARAELKQALAECSPGQQYKFKQIFAHGRPETPINDVVDQLEPDILSSAMDLVGRTHVQNEKREIQYYKEQASS